jgi:DNA-3-methyladenine glycosylase
MFGPAGVAYVYLVYGMYDCLNVVVGADGQPAAVLIRALEPLEGMGLMREDRARREMIRRRRIDPVAERAIRTRIDVIPGLALARGPGLVGAALGIDRSWTGMDLFDPRSPLRIEAGPGAGPPSSDASATARIGVAYAGEPWASVPWRFALAGHPSVSGPRVAR